MNTVRVALAEDNVLLREGISRLVAASADFELAGVAADLPQLLALVREQQPDVVVTDIRMPPTGTDEGIGDRPPGGGRARAGSLGAARVRPVAAHRAGDPDPRRDGPGQVELGDPAALFVTERAVEKHTNSIFAELGLSEERDVNRRVKAVLVYLSNQDTP